MTTPFTYSILQYKHSFILGEAVNVGVLFHFPADQKFEFIAGNVHRIKAIYLNFDQTLYHYLIKNIEHKISEASRSFFDSPEARQDFKKYLHTVVLPEDATVLQFTEPVSVLLERSGSSDGDRIGKIVDEFAKLLLPGIMTKKPEIVRHTESFLIKRFTHYILEKHRELKKKLVKNQVIKTTVDNRHIELKFDLAWTNGSTNLIKPLSFDLTEEKSIQDKSAINYGYLNLLGDYAERNNFRFDLIVSKPTDKSLWDSYDNALGLLELSAAPKRIVTETELKDYSEEAVEELLKH